MKIEVAGALVGKCAGQTVSGTVSWMSAPGHGRRVYVDDGDVVRGQGQERDRKTESTIHWVLDRPDK